MSAPAMTAASLLRSAATRLGRPAGALACARSSSFSPSWTAPVAQRRPLSSDAGGALEDERVLAHLVCPISKFPLRYDREHARLVCDEINVAYPIRDGVPVLVPADGRILSSDDDDGGEQ